MLYLWFLPDLSSSPLPRLQLLFEWGPLMSLSALIDWCAFTVQTTEAKDAVLAALGLNGRWVKMPKGGLGYKTLDRNGHVSMFSDGSKGMGYHFEMSGQGCRQFESDAGIVNAWFDLFATVKKFDGSFTRIDLAVDDKDGYFTVEQCRDYAKACKVRSLFKQSRNMAAIDLSTGETAETLYFGSAQSRVQVRIYDKAKEQKETGHWVRTELQLRSERADVVAAFILAQTGGTLGKLISGILRNYVNFVEPNLNDPDHRERWPLASWWSNFLDDAERVRIAIKKVEPTIDSLKQWVKRQVGPTLACILAYFKGDSEFLDEVLADGQTRLSPRHLAILAAT